MKRPLCIGLVAAAVSATVLLVVMQRQVAGIGGFLGHQPSIELIEEAPEVPGGWSYAEPGAWSGLFPSCGGSAQSPVDIVGARHDNARHVGIPAHTPHQPHTAAALSG